MCIIIIATNERICMKEYTYTKVVTVTDEDVNAIIDSAFRGTGYWCDKATLIGEQDKFMITEGLTHGCYFKLHDIEQNKWHNLTLKKLLKGLSLAKNFDIDNFDQTDADQAIQLALFGEVLYA